MSSWLDYYNKQNKFTDIISQYISKFCYNNIQKRKEKIRYTTFVEIMCPLFEINFSKSYPNVKSRLYTIRFGLDALWGLMLDHKNMGVIDYISVVHMRPVEIFKKENRKF